jgi:CspA family cold shock protein
MLDTAMTDKRTGVVKFFSEQKKFGFIAPDDGSADVFVHIAALQSSGLVTLHKGQRIEFVAESDRRGGRGPRAVHVTAL